MRFSKCVTTSHQRNSLTVIHAHARECIADVVCRCERVRVAIWALGVDVDQTHLHSSQRVLEIALTRVTAVLATRVLQPLFLRAPVCVLFRLPNIRTTTAETECFETHRFHRDVTCQNEQVCPRNLVAIFLLDGPKQATRFVEVAVVRPAVERCETLLSCGTTPTTIGCAVSASGVPCHAHEHRAVVTIICRPPVLAIGHQSGQICFERVQIELFELFLVINLTTKRVCLLGVLVEDFQVQRIWPPIAVAAYIVACVHCCAMHDWAFANVVTVHSTSKKVLI